MTSSADENVSVSKMPSSPRRCSSLSSLLYDVVTSADAIPHPKLIPAILMSIIAGAEDCDKSSFPQTPERYCEALCMSTE